MVKGNRTSLTKTPKTKISQPLQTPTNTTIQQQTPIQPQQPSIMNTVKDGMAIGFGASLGRSVFDNVSSFFKGGEKKEKDEKIDLQPTHKCFNEQNDFLTCLRMNEVCNDKEEILRKCLKN